MRKTLRQTALAAAVAGTMTLTPTLADENLVRNGSFELADDPLAGWKTVYDAPGESLYAGNATRVQVLPSEGGRRGVLCFDVPHKYAIDLGGVKVDSRPIPFDPAGRYRFSAWARASGTNCRILLEGYRWRPGIRPHSNPELHELRKCYKFKQLLFGGRRGGDMGGVGRSWEQASREFPEEGLSPLAAKMLDKIEFVVVHVVGIGSGAGKLYVDDVRLGRLK